MMQLKSSTVKVRSSLLKHAFIYLALLAGATIARTAEIPVIKEPVIIPQGETRSFEFGTVPQANTTVLLTVTSRIDAVGLGGSSHYLNIRLNGKEVLPAKSRTALRLLNKPNVSPVAAGVDGTWHGKPGWRVVYAPDFEKARTQKFYVGDPYTLVLDVTDLTNPAAENRLEFSYTKNDSLKKYVGTNADLIIQKINIETKPGTSPTMALPPDSAPFINTGQPAAGPAPYTGKIEPGGGFSINIGGKSYTFSSSYSYPDAGFNRLAAGQPDKSGQPTWKVSTGQDGSIQASGDDYSIARTVRFTPRKVEVADTITNKRDTPIGIMVRHEMNLSGIQNPTIRLAGNPDPAVNDYYAPGNPSVYTTTTNGAIAMICEDDVFRNQALLYTRNEAGEPPIMGLRTDMLRLSPRETYTLRWSVYPIGGRDYYDFLNLVRADWGANYRVDGAWYWGYNPYTILAMPLDEIREKFTRLGIRYVALDGGWVDRPKDSKRIGFGAGVLEPYWKDYRDRIRESATRLRQAVPGIKVVAYYDTQRDTSENSPQRFSDSKQTDAQGKQLTTDWNGVYDRTLTYNVVATLDNSFGKAMLEVAERYMDEMIVDGIYWDEMENTAYGYPWVTYDIPDGHSCIIDPKTHRIQRELGITTLLGKTHRLAVIDRVKRKGGIVLGNGYTASRDMLNTKILRMIEIQHNDFWHYQGLLATPLGYMGGRMDFGNVTRGINLGCLPVGTKFTYEYDMPRYLFPFTPIELHSGYLLGQERIVGTHSGNYGWPGERVLVQVHHFNKDGKLTTTDFPTTIGTKARTAVKIGPEEAYVLERLPITLEPAGNAQNWKATISQVQYSETGASFHIDAPQGGTLLVRKGRFPFAYNATLPVQVGTDAVQQLKAVNGVLKIAVPTGFSGVVRIGEP